MNRTVSVFMFAFSEDKYQTVSGKYTRQEVDECCRELCNGIGEIGVLKGVFWVGLLRKLKSRERKYRDPGTVVHAFNPNTGEAEADRSL